MEIQIRRALQAKCINSRNPKFLYLKFAIVILNWNGKKLLQKFLPSISAHSAGADIYVVDNGSDDDSVSFVAENFKAVRLIQHDKNYGYTQGYNLALRQIQADVYCLLNSDVEVTANWLEPFYALFQKPEIAVAQPKILDYKQRDKFEYTGAAGGFIDSLGYPYCRGRVFFTLESDRGQYDDTLPIFWASGACLFIRCSVFHELRGFDADYFAHQEEIDLCWRAQNRGYQVYYTQQSKVYHIGGATLDARHPRKTFLNFRNSLFNLIKNLPFQRIPFVLFSRLVLDVFAAFYFLCRGSGKQAQAVFIAHLSFYRYFFKIYKKRRANPRFVKNYYHGCSVAFNYFVSQKRYYKKQACKPDSVSTLLG